MEKHTTIILFLSFLSLFLGILCIVILHIYHKGRSLATRLLILGILSIIITTISNASLHTLQSLKFPHFLLVSYPFHYWAAPAFFLYVKVTLSHDEKIPWYYWLHLLPGFIHFIEFLPFYLQTAAEKQALLQANYDGRIQLVSHFGGWLPPFYHPFIKTALGIMYMLWSLNILKTTMASHKEWIKSQRESWKWLHILVLLMLLFYLYAIVAYIFRGQLVNFKFIITLPTMVVLFFISITLVFLPRVLYGFSPPSQINPDIEEAMEPLLHLEKKVIITDEQAQKIRRAIKEQFEIPEKFLIQGYNLNQLSRDTSFPVYQLSHYINYHLGLNFSDMVNAARINYLVQQVESGEWSSLSLEGMAKESGFSSRYTFIKAFKKNKGTTPSAYINNLKSNPNE